MVASVSGQSVFIICFYVMCFEVMWVALTQPPQYLRPNAYSHWGDVVLQGGTSVDGQEPRRAIIAVVLRGRLQGCLLPVV